MAATADLLSGVAELVKSRVPAADLDERDPDYIRESLPRLWLLASLYFRAEVRGLGNVPEEGPVLLVGNHSGGNLTPDTGVFTLAFSTYFGVERVFHQLAHNLVLSMPFLSFLRKYGTVAASHDNARKALRAGAAVLVYPGGDYEVHRPIWESRRIDFGGRKGFLRLALEEGVPIVPVVSIGGQEAAPFLARGGGGAQPLSPRRPFPPQVAPPSPAPPRGPHRGGMFGPPPPPASSCSRCRRRRRGASTGATCSATSRCGPRSPSRRCPPSTCGASSAPSRTSTRSTSTSCA